MPTRTPILVISGLDATDMEVAAMGVQCDLPDAALVRLGVDGEAGQVHWRVSDFTGVVEDSSYPVAHPCMSCSMREAILPTLMRLADSGRWSALVVTLPVSAEPMPMSLGIARGEVDGRPARDVLDLRCVIAVVSAPDLCDGLFGDPLLADLDLAMIPDDRRSYAEALAGQIEYSDAIVLSHPELDEPDAALLDHLRRPNARVYAGLGSFATGSELLGLAHDADAAQAFVDPRHRRPTGAPGAGGIVTVELSSWRAFHPERLLRRLEDLGAGDVRGRGAFWLPGRPGAAIAWESSGAQLSIGAIGDWGDAERCTRIVATTDAETAAVMQEAFADAIMTDAEMLTARQRWTGRRDGFEEWLGDAESDVA